MAHEWAKGLLAALLLCALVLTVLPISEWQRDVSRQQTLDDGLQGFVDGLFGPWLVPFELLSLLLLAALIGALYLSAKRPPEERDAL